MLSAYRPLLQLPGIGRFVIGAMLARIGAAMFGVAIIVMVSSRRGSYGLAGAVSAVGLLVLAVAGPLIGRLIDKYGQGRVARPFVLFSAAAGLATAALSYAGAPVWTLFVAYGLSACLPVIGPLSRARWAHLLRDDPDTLHAAMSFEQVCDECGFVIGPVIAVLLSTMVTPEAGLIGAVVLFTLGELIFLSARSTEPAVMPHEDRPRGLAVGRPGLLLVATILTMTGLIFGSNEVIAVAVADARGDKGFSSVVLAAFATGSMLAGIAYGTRMSGWTLSRRLVVCAGLMCLLEAPALLASNLWLLAVVMFVAGSATAPMLITSLSLTQKLVPAAFITEGMAVAVTGILVGISIGTSVGGWAVGALGAQAAYAVPVLAGLVSVVLAGAGLLHLERAELADA